MDRIFKFRFWDGEKFIYFTFPDDYFRPDVIDIMRSGKARFPYLQQFIGELDINFDEVYEGDIIYGDSDENDVVVFITDSFVLQPLNDNCVYWECCEIIGNIFEKPELVAQDVLNKYFFNIG